MRKIMQLSLGLMLALVVSCGGGGVCEDAFDKVKKCASTVNCDTINDITKKMNCEIIKANYSKYSSWSDVVKACEDAGEDDCSCSGKMETNAQKVMDCNMDPESCTCDS